MNVFVVVVVVVKLTHKSLCCVVLDCCKNCVDLRAQTKPPENKHATSVLYAKRVRASKSFVSQCKLSYVKDDDDYDYDYDYCARWDFSNGIRNGFVCLLSKWEDTCCRLHVTTKSCMYFSTCVCFLPENGTELDNSRFLRSQWQNVENSKSKSQEPRAESHSARS